MGGKCRCPAPSPSPSQPGYLCRLTGLHKKPGATVTRPPVEGQAKTFNGSCIVAHAATKEEVLDEIKKDIYATTGVWNLDDIIIQPVCDPSSPYLAYCKRVSDACVALKLMTAFRKELPGAAW